MQDWDKVYVDMLLTEEKKQTKKHQNKKGKAKSKTAEKGLTPERMKVLAHHDAQREIRKAEAKVLNKKVTAPAQLNDADKLRLNRKMNTKTIENDIAKLEKKKLREKQLTKQENDLKAQAESTKDESKKKELKRKIKAISAEIDAIKDTYAPAKKEEKVKQ